MRYVFAWEISEMLMHYRCAAQHLHIPIYVLTLNHVQHNYAVFAVFSSLSKKHRCSISLRAFNILTVREVKSPAVKTSNQDELQRT